MLILYSVALYLIVFIKFLHLLYLLFLYLNGILNNKMNEWMNIYSFLYKTRNTYSSYRTRNCTDIQLPRYNLEYSKKSFHYSGLKAWNETPTTIRELSTLQQFKKHLKIHLRSWIQLKHDSLEDQPHPLNFYVFIFMYLLCCIF